MLSIVRNCGAESETSPPSTSMIATRLSSRWRAIGRGQPLAAGARRVRRRVVATGAQPSDAPVAAGRRPAGLVAAVRAAGRREHHPLLGGLVARDLGGDPALVQDEDPVGHREDLGQVARDEDDPEPGGGELGDDPVDLDLGADVDAARRLVEDQDRRLRGQPLGQDDLLLVAARQRRRRAGRRRSSGRGTARCTRRRRRARSSARTSRRGNRRGRIGSVTFWAIEKSRTRPSWWRSSGR